MKYAYKLRFLPLLASVTSVLCSCCLLAAHSLLYPDPTAELLVAQSKQMADARLWLYISLCAMGFSLCYCILIDCRHKKAAKTTFPEK